MHAILRSCLDRRFWPRMISYCCQLLPLPSFTIVVSMPAPVSKFSLAAPQAISVAQLTAQIKDLVEGGFPSVWVVGRDLELFAAAVGAFLFHAQG